MRLDLAGLAARLERAAEGKALRPAMERGAGMLAEGVRARLSVRPGGAHNAPWVESGALRDSIGVSVDGDGLTAVVGSSDPAAAPQEMGTVRMAARPFLAPAAGEMGEEVARAVGARVAASLAPSSGADEGVPDVIQASATGTDVEQALLLGGLGLLLYSLSGRGAGSVRPGVTPSGPAIVHQSPPEKGNAPPANLAKPGEATLADDRREHILDGDGKGGGGHGPGRGTPKKSEFPADWSDDKTVGAILDVANDAASVRYPADRGRTVVEGTRDGVDIRVIIGADGKAIVTAYPTNVSSNKRK